MPPKSKPMLNLTLKQLEQLLRSTPNSLGSGSKSSQTQRHQASNTWKAPLYTHNAKEIWAYRGTWESAHISGQTWTVVKSPNFLHLCPEK